MSDKKCTKCGEIKPLSEFHKNKKCKDGVLTRCKLCANKAKNDWLNSEKGKKHKKDYYEKTKHLQSKQKKEKRKANNDYYKKKDALHRSENKDSLLIYQREYTKKNKDKIKENTAIYYKKNKQKMNAQARIYQDKNKDDLTTKRKKHYIDNKQTINKRNKDYYIKNREKSIERGRVYAAKRRKNDPEFKIIHALRGRFHHHLNRTGNKTEKFIELLGCSTKEVREHLESQWLDGMSWDNHSVKGWHIDHIIPCKKFDLTKESEQLKCFHYSNLQPLWAIDNLKKGDR